MTLTACNCTITGHEANCPFNLGNRQIPIETEYFPPVYFLINPSPLKGWLCPRCQAINAPWAEQCTCAPISWTITWSPPLPRIDYWINEASTQVRQILH